MSFINPVPGGTMGRTDQGVDISAPPGTPVLAIAASKVIGRIANWFQGQPYEWFQITSGPSAGQYWYAAEQIQFTAQPGQTVQQGQQIGTIAPTGTGTEFGYATASGETLARATTGYTEGQVTQAGTRFRQALAGAPNAPGVARPGGGTPVSYTTGATDGSPSWWNTPLNPAVDPVRDYADSFASAAGFIPTIRPQPGQVPTAPNGAGVSGTPSGNPASMAQMVAYLQQLGFTKIAASGIVGNLQQESSLNPNSPGGFLGQWQGSRLSNLFAYTGTQHPTAAQQLQFIYHEMSTQYQSAFDAVQAATSPQQAADIISQQYEKPGIPNLSAREAYAQQAYNASGGTPTGGGTTQQVSYTGTATGGTAEYVDILGIPGTGLLQHGLNFLINPFVHPGQSLKSFEGSMGWLWGNISHGFSNSWNTITSGIHTIGDVISFIGKALAFLTNPMNWLRMVEFLTGMFILFYGMNKMFHSSGRRASRVAAATQVYSQRQQTRRETTRARRMTETERERSRRAAATERARTERAAGVETHRTYRATVRAQGGAGPGARRAGPAQGGASRGGTKQRARQTAKRIARKTKYLPK